MSINGATSSIIAQMITTSECFAVLARIAQWTRARVHQWVFIQRTAISSITTWVRETRIFFVVVLNIKVFKL